MITKHKVECTTAAHGNPLSTGIVILGDRRTRHFVIGTYKVGDGCGNIGCQNRLYPLPVLV